MKICECEVLTVDIPMRVSVEHALAARNVARNVIVAVRDKNGAAGWGESCPRPYVTGETVESVKQTLAEVILPQVAGRTFDGMDQVTVELTAVLDTLARDQQAAFCACELAVLDLAGQTFGASAGSVIGPVVAEQMRYSGVIASNDLEGVKKYAAFMKQFGFADVKVKVGASLESNLAFLKTSRAILGDDVTLRIDANSAWSGEEAVQQLEAMAEFELTGVEQPVPADDLDGMKTVTAAGLVPVVADESLCSLTDAETLIAQKACDIFNVRISKCGGLINAGRIHRRAVEAGLKCQLGAQVGETGLLSAAGRHFASRCEDVVWCEGSYGTFLLEKDITDPDVTIGPGGAAPAIDTPGLGVKPIAETLQGYTVDSWTQEV